MGNLCIQFWRTVGKGVAWTLLNFFLVKLLLFFITGLEAKNNKSIIFSSSSLAYVSLLSE